MNVHLRRTVIAVVATAALVLPATPAFASAAEHQPAAGLTFDLGPAPSGLPANCPFQNGDANFAFLSGTAIQHDTQNANGDWGGFTAQGTAVFYEGTDALYQGHLTIWGGGGNNAKAQTEGGLTLSFNGVGVGGSLSVHITQHATTNASGTPTSNVLDVNITCS
jgi:hypothetical protein